MTPETAKQLAVTFCADDPAAAPLIQAAFDVDPVKAKRARTAVNALWPSVFGDIQESIKRAPRTKMLWEGIKPALRGLDRYDSGDFTGLLSTGLEKLDRRLRGGMAPGRLYLLGAPTGSGKTSFVAQMANSGAQAGSVLIVSPEMSLESLAEREIIRESRAREWDRNPWQVTEEHRILKTAAQAAHSFAATKLAGNKLPIHVLDQPDATMDDIEDVAKSITCLKLVVIDYAQQVAGLDDERPRYLQVGDVATRSVALAMRLGIPVIVASQVNEIKDKNARTFSFRETAILEHKAHLVLILDVRWSDDGDIRKVDSAHLACSKNRSGPTFRLEVKYTPELYLIEDMPKATQIRRWQDNVPIACPLPYRD